MTILYRAKGLSESALKECRKTFMRSAPALRRTAEPWSIGLALQDKAWQRRIMTDKKAPAPRAAGAFIALGLLAGSLMGVVLHQPTIGLLAGFALGSALAIGLWLIDRRR